MRKVNNLYMLLYRNTFVATAGRVLNRFSADIGLLDSVLPYLFLYVFSVSLNYHQHVT